MTQLTETISARAEEWRERTTPAAATAARLITGMLWLSNTDWKRPPNFGRPNRGLWLFTNHGIENEVFGPYRWFLEEVVVSNWRAFGWFTLVAEVVLAACFLAGRFTRTAALLGIGMSIAITLSVLNTPGEYNWAYYMMIALHLAVFALGAGPWSVDALRAKIRAGDPAAIRRSVTYGRYGLGAVLAAVGTYLAIRQRDNSFTLDASGNEYFPAVATGNQALRGTVALGLVLVLVGIVVALVATSAAARPIGIALVVGAVACSVTYGTHDNFLGGAPSTSAILLVAAAFLIAAGSARTRPAPAPDSPAPA